MFEQTHPDADARIDYRRPDAWERIAALLDSGIELRPSANCGRVRCEPGWEWQPRLADYDLWLAVQGRGALQIGQQRHAIRPGTLFFLRPGDSGWATQQLDDRLTVVYLHLEISGPPPERAQLDAALLPSRAIPFPDPSQIDQLLTRAVRLIESRQRLLALEAAFVLRQALVEIYRQDAANQGMLSAQRDRRVEQVIAALRSQPDRRMSLEEAAALAELAPAYFSRLFTREAGMSYRAFVLRTRLERARALLDETSMPIGQIARALGYEDVFLFSRQFKQQYGYAPRQMRRG